MISQTQYAVEVPGLGFMGLAANLVTNDKEGIDGMAMFIHPSDAVESALSLRARYRALGLPEVADTVRVVKRAAITTFTDWEPLHLPVGNDK